MRQADMCPVCGGRTGRVESDIEEGVEVKKYWHTDLESCKEFCIEYPCGETKQVFQAQGDYEPTGPRA